MCVWPVKKMTALDLLLPPRLPPRQPSARRSARPHPPPVRGKQGHNEGWGARGARGGGGGGGGGARKSPGQGGFFAASPIAKKQGGVPVSPLGTPSAAKAKARGGFGKSFSTPRKSNSGWDSSDDEGMFEEMN